MVVSMNATTVKRQASTATGYRLCGNTRYEPVLRSVRTQVSLVHSILLRIGPHQRSRNRIPSIKHVNRDHGYVTSWPNPQIREQNVPC